MTDCKADILEFNNMSCIKLVTSFSYKSALVKLDNNFGEKILFSVIVKKSLMKCKREKFSKMFIKTYDSCQRSALRMTFH